MTIFKKRDLKEQRLREIGDELKKISDAMAVADSGFNEVCDHDLLDAIIYDKSALMARYSFLIKELRRLQSQ